MATTSNVAQTSPIGLIIPVIEIKTSPNTPQGVTDLKKLRDKVLELDNHECVRCGEKDENQRLIIHPIDPARQLSPDDFVALCPHCAQLVKTLKLQTMEHIIQWSSTELAYAPVGKRIFYRAEWQNWGLQMDLKIMTKHTGVQKTAKINEK